MKKIAYIFLLVAAIVFISSRTTSKNTRAENISKPAALKESKAEPKTTADSPRIHFMLHKNTGQANWSPAMWWSYDPAKMDGC